MMKSTLLLTALSSAFIAGAASLSPQQALYRAMEENVPSTVRRAAGSNTMDHVFTKATRNTECPAFYIFENGNSEGFYILSADDRFPAVIGYAEKGTFNDASKMPQFMSWLDFYAREIDFALQSGEVESHPVRRSAGVLPCERTAVEPIVKTEWDQTAPYFNDCPAYNGSHYLTGCVATAMAQVMKSQEWPKVNGDGTNSYQWNDMTISYNFSEANFDWANMLDIYKGVNYNSTQAKAVANLMRACGTSVNMRYNPTDSGAFSTSIAIALEKYFGYDKGVHYVMRDYYTSERWNELIYNEVANGRAVIYDGVSDAGGHCFVCDGYSQDNYFHINWGWSGVSNGYYLLSVLSPEQLGSGASMGNFNSDQDAIIGIQPPVEGSHFIAPVFGLGNNFGAYSKVDVPGGGINFKLGPTGMNTGYINYCNLEYYGTLGALIYKDAQLIKVIKSSRHKLPASTDDGNLSGPGAFPITINKEDLEPGHYYVAPGILPDNGEWQRIPFHWNNPQYTEITFDGTTFTVENVSSYETPNILVQSIDYPEEINPNEAFTVKYEVTNFANKGSFTTLWLVFSDKDDNIIYTKEVEVSLRRNGTVSVSTDVEEGLPQGEYTVTLRNVFSEIMNIPVNMNVGDSGHVNSVIDPMQTLTVYTLQGLKVISGVTESQLSSLPEGIYIITDGQNTQKRVIR